MQTEDETPDPVRDIEAERSLIGTAIRFPTPETLDELRRALPAFHAFRGVAQAVLDSAGEGATDIGSILAELKAQDIEECGRGGLAMMASEAIAPSGARSYADRILRKGYRRVLARRADRLSQDAANGQTDAELQAALAELIDLEPPTQEMPFASLASILEKPANPTSWLVRGLWTHPEVAILAGDGGIGKTWIGLHVAACLATGSPVFGRYQVDETRRVGIIDLERGPAALERRLRLVARAFDGQPGLDMVEVVSARLLLDDAEDGRRLLAHVKARGYGWLMIDSFQAALAGDDIAAKDIQLAFARTLYPIRDAGCSILIIDHVRKLRGDKILDAPGEALQGSKRKRNAVDSLIGLRKHNDCLAWIPDKANHHAGLEAGQIRLEITEDAATVRWEGGLDMASDACQDAILALLKDEGEKARGEILGRIVEPGRSLSTVKRALLALTRRGILDSCKQGRETWFSYREETECGSKSS